MAPTSPTTSSNIEIFSSSSASTCSSSVPRVTRLNTNTSRSWPMRSMRPMRCSIAIGFQGTSKLIRVLQNWMLRPSPPDCVHSRTVAWSRNSAMAASFSGPAEAAVEAGEGHARLGKTIGEMGERLARMDEDELLLPRVALHQLDQAPPPCRPFRSRPSARQAWPKPDRQRLAPRSAPRRSRPRPGEDPAAPSR